jgi:hypothetical protein
VKKREHFHGFNPGPIFLSSLLVQCLRQTESPIAIHPRGQHEKENKQKQSSGHNDPADPRREALPDGNASGCICPGDTVVAV